MTRSITRRRMLRTSAAIASGVWLGTTARSRAADSPNEKLSIACIGIGGQGRSNVDGTGKHENIIALCDVDEQRAGNAFEKHPKAKRFVDFRKMFDALEKDIDAVTISTPDHTHFHPALWAMTRGKHVYLEKPLAHNVWEVRELTKLAAEKKLATQLGAQRHAIGGLRAGVEIARSGVLGEITEVHSWIGGDRGMPKIPTDAPAVPSHVNWDLWLGPAKPRPYHPTYCPYGWRFWWSFGTGETGNWGCHILDIPFWALDLKSPTRVEASGPAVHEQTTPKALHAVYQFPASDKRGPVTLHWHHTKSDPPVLAEHGAKGDGFNTFFIGKKASLLCGFGKWKLVPEQGFEGYKPPKTFADSPGFHKEWLNAIRGGEPATCNFNYTGPLTETVLLGNVAYRAGEPFDWDAENLKTIGSDKAQGLLREEYRKGWET